jgi:hypothetical protein
MEWANRRSLSLQPLESRSPVTTADGFKATIPTSDEQDGCGRRLLDWAHEEEPYVAPSSPYDTNIIDDRPEVTRVWSLHFVLDSGRPCSHLVPRVSLRLHVVPRVTAIVDL